MKIALFGTSIESTRGPACGTGDLATASGQSHLRNMLRCTRLTRLVRATQT